MKELTKAEEQVMQILWNLNKAYVKDIVEFFDDPKPAYNTVSTIVRILEKKGFISHKAFGNTHRYYPAVAKETYTKSFMKNFVKNYFSDSYKEMVSFFTNERDLSIRELEELRLLMENEIKRRNK